MVERNTEDVGVGSSILSSPTNDFKRNLFKNETEGYKTKTQISDVIWTVGVKPYLIRFKITFGKRSWLNWIEQLAFNQWVMGSSPIGRTNMLLQVNGRLTVS